MTFYCHPHPQNVMTLESSDEGLLSEGDTAKGNEQEMHGFVAVWHYLYVRKQQDSHTPPNIFLINCSRKNNQIQR